MCENHLQPAAQTTTKSIFLAILRSLRFYTAKRAMFLTPEELHSNLGRLRKNLTSARCCVPETTRESSARVAAAAMPLCHTTPEGNLLPVLTSGALLSAEQRGARPREVDRLLGGANEICFYLGSAAFPDNEFGFLFSADLTNDFKDRASATPFDSGGCIGRYFPHLQRS